MARQSQQQQTPTQGRVGDEPRPAVETKPRTSPQSTDRGRDRNPGDMRRDADTPTEIPTDPDRLAGVGTGDPYADVVDEGGDNLEKSTDTDVEGTGFDESRSDLDTDAGDSEFTPEDETNARGGSV